MKIRAYRPSDVGEMAGLFYDTVHTINAAHYTKEQLDAWAPAEADLAAWESSLRGRFCLVAEEDGRIAGFGDIDDTGYLDRLYVRADCIGRGIASALCDGLEGHSAVDVTVHASVTAKGFFEGRGYVTVRKQQVERRGVLLTNFVMVKKAKR